MATVEYKQLWKILLLGESGSGKTQLLSAYINQGSIIQTNETTNVGGIDFKVKTIELDGNKIRLQLWDTAGLERFRSMTSSFYRGAHGILMVFDVKDELSFNSIQYWLKEVDEHVKTSCIPKFVVGNVTGCSNYERQVTPERATDFANSQNMRYVEYDLKENKSVDMIFTDMAASIMDALAGRSGNTEAGNQGVQRLGHNSHSNPNEGNKCCN